MGIIIVLLNKDIKKLLQSSGIAPTTLFQVMYFVVVFLSADDDDDDDDDDGIGFLHVHHSRRHQIDTTVRLLEQHILYWQVLKQGCCPVPCS